MKSLLTGLSIFLVLLMLVAACGCSSEQITALKESVSIGRQQVADSQQILDDLQEQKAELDKKIPAMPEGPAKEQAQKVSEKYGEAIDQAKQIKTVAEERLKDFEDRLANAQDEIDVLIAGLAAAAPAMPASTQPFIAMGLLGLTTIGGFLKAYRNGKRAKTAEGEAAAGRKVISAVEKVKDDKGVVNFKDPTTQLKLSVEMGADGKALVDSVQE